MSTWSRTGNCVLVEKFVYLVVTYVPWANACKRPHVSVALILWLGRLTPDTGASFSETNSWSSTELALASSIHA